MQHGDIMDLDARVLCQDNVDACETPREADIGESQRTESGGELVRIHCSQPVANAIIAEHSQTLVTIANNLDADNHDSPALQPSGLDRPQHSRSPSPAAIDSSAGLICGSREESILNESTRHGSPPSKSV